VEGSASSFYFIAQFSNVLWICYSNFEKNPIILRFYFGYQKWLSHGLTTTIYGKI
jgi:hypothetical protein